MDENRGRRLSGARSSRASSTTRKNMRKSKNLREKLQKLDREIAAVDRKLWAWGGPAAQFMPKALKNKRAALDERRKAVRLERKKYVRL